MGMMYLLDTNTISDYLGGRLPDASLDFLDQIIDDTPRISVINWIELLGHNKPELSKCQIMIANCYIYDLTEEIIIQTIALRKSRRIRIPDAIIAATDLVNGLTLITHNLSDFQSIANLNFLDSYALV